MALGQSPARRAQTDARSMWVNELRLRRGYSRAMVAVANKNALVIWAVLSSGEACRAAE